VHRQHEALAETLGSHSAQVRAPEPDPLVLDQEEDTRTLDEKYPVTVTVRPIPQQRPDFGAAPVRAAPEPERRLFGLLGRRKPKEEMRLDPPAQRVVQQPRATSQVVSRPAPEGQRPQQPGQQPEDLFPDHKRDDQFEIPAFLRRQSS
jgi:hypothetical protein